MYSTQGHTNRKWHNKWRYVHVIYFFGVCSYDALQQQGHNVLGISSVQGFQICWCQRSAWSPAGTITCVPPWASETTDTSTWCWASDARTEAQEWEKQADTTLSSVHVERCQPVRQALQQMVKVTPRRLRQPTAASLPALR